MQYVSTHTNNRLLDQGTAGLRTHSNKTEPGHRSRIRYLSKKNSRILTNFPQLKKIRKNSYKNSLNARVGVAFQWNSTQQDEQVSI